MKIDVLQLKWILRTTIAFLALVTLQFWLGMSINLEVDLPARSGTFFSLLQYYADLSIFVLAHVVVGILLLATSLVYLFFALRVHLRAFLIISGVGIVAIASAIINGLLFLLYGQSFGNSIGMAMSAVSALIAYSAGLYYLGIYRAHGLPADRSLS